MVVVSQYWYWTKSTFFVVMVLGEKSQDHQGYSSSGEHECWYHILCKYIQ